MLKISNANTKQYYINNFVFAQEKKHKIALPEPVNVSFWLRNHDIN